MLTGDEKYLKGAESQLPLLESFGGKQPSFHLYDIAIRHWDGYWFGKDRIWGDTFPHYWSTLSGIAFRLYAKSDRKTRIYRTGLEYFPEQSMPLHRRRKRKLRLYLSEQSERTKSSSL